MAYHSIHIKCKEAEAETISTVLLENNYLGTSYERGILVAYILKENLDEAQLKTILKSLNLSIDQQHETKEENWNALWESNFHESIIDDRVQIRAPFHPEKALEHQIVIHPKMAFGTGQHGTTQLMIKAMLQHSFLEADVLDMGCGSGILAIMAEKLGAKTVLAVDYDENSIRNCQENVQLNKVQNVSILQDENLEQVTKTFDIILSNIVKNINLSLLDQFEAKLRAGGTLILCGLLKNDLQEAQTKAKALNLNLTNHTSDREWLQLAFIKPI